MADSAKINYFDSKQLQLTKTVNLLKIFKIENILSREFSKNEEQLTQTNAIRQFPNKKKIELKFCRPNKNYA